jgi:hypothetical protein
LALPLVAAFFFGDFFAVVVFFLAAAMEMAPNFLSVLISVLCSLRDAEFGAGGWLHPYKSQRSREARTELDQRVALDLSWLGTIGCDLLLSRIHPWVHRL